ncbi:hypothetical protein [Metabacillus fastidiosus]|uniref:hypothetical protein n=1 Tax=Metabacillus fastidiosus TaxID=1458 RepID=UPI002E243BBB|nr:hypothetical protein [Metabacillus fastidiosus]
MKIVNVIDAPCGYGKTSWAIQYMNSLPKESHQFIYVTPFLDEVQRVKESVTTRKFYKPETKKGETKLGDLHKLLGQGRDICTTHALFQMATSETIELLKANRYTLIMDEVLNVIEQIPLKKSDLKLLLEANAVDIVTRENRLQYIQWNEQKIDYNTRYNSIKEVALTNNLMYCDNSALIWNFPCGVFSSFQDVFILTYLFKGQIQKSYYDLHGIKYRYLSVVKEEYDYELVPYNMRKKHDKQNLIEKIEIYEGQLNDVGDLTSALSKSWFINPKKKDLILKLKNNARNYLMNICKAIGEDVIWTTIKGEKEKIQKQVSPRGYSKAFLAMTARATNDFRDRYILAYLVNRYLNPIQKKFFEQYDVKIDEHTWALSELIQWIWRSRIRDDKSIKIYIPSRRMRELFKSYLEDDHFEKAPDNAIVDEPPSDWNL